MTDPFVCVVIAPPGDTGELVEFMTSLQNPSDFCFLILDRPGDLRIGTHPSDLASLTRLSVAAATDGVELKRGDVLVVSSAAKLEIDRQNLRVSTDDTAPADNLAARMSHNVDALSRAFGEMLVGVAFSVMDTDAMLALKQVSAQGGFRVVVQDDSLPEVGRKNRAPGIADLIASPAKAAKELSRHVTQTRQAVTTKDALSDAPVEQLKAELVRTRAELERVVQDFETANEKLKSSNEDLQAMNKALQASNAELEASQERIGRTLSDIETLYRHAPIGLAQLTPGLEYLRINDALARVNGVPAAETVGRRVIDVLPEFAPQAEKIMAEVLRTGKAVGPVEMRGSISSDAGPSDAGGDRVWLQTWVPLRGDDGSITSILVSVQDVTERERYAAALRENALRLRKTMDAMVMFVGVLSPEGILLEANEPAIALSGLDRTDLIGKPFHECFWWAGNTARQDRLRDAMRMAAKGRSVRYDVDVRAAGDSEITIDFQLSPYFGEDGRVAYLIPSAVDITQRKHIENSLKSSLRSLELATQSGKLALFDWDLPTSRVEWSDYYYMICGYEVGSVQPTYDLWRIRVHPEDIDRVEAAIAAAKKSGKPFSSAYRMLHPSGRIVEVETSGTYLYGDQGPVRMVGVSRDVTALKASEARFRTILEIAQVGIVLSRRDGTISLANDAALELLGYDNDAAQEDRRWQQHLDADHAGAARRITTRLFRNGRVTPVEYTLRSLTGERRPILLSAAQIATSGDEYVSFLVDLTDQKQSEAHRQILIEELNHRVKNSLATIQAMAAHTMRHAKSPNDFQTTFAGRLRAMAAAHEILSRTDTGLVKLSDLVQSQVGPHARTETGQLRLKGDEVALSPDNAHALGLVLHELATNAAKYGSLSVPNGKVDIFWKSGACAIDLTWHESGGPGVAPPVRTGFGTRLIESTFTHAAKGSAKIEYHPAGLIARLTISQED